MLSTMTSHDSSTPRPPSPWPQNLHAPWRFSYMQMLSQQEASAPSPASAKPAPAPCFLRAYYLNPHLDQANHVIVRTGAPASAATTPNAGQYNEDRGGLIMLNKYPYSNGHLLVCLGESRQRLLDYTQPQRAELWSLVDLAVELVERALAPQGVNVGLNQGAAAGAGVPEHVHVHVVPRWSGDVNFMTACAQIRVIPSAMEDMAMRMREVWQAIRS